MNIVNDILVNTLFPDTDFVQTLSMNSVVPKYVENQEKGNPSVCKNCAEAPFKDLHIYGRSEQMTTTGAQLIDINSFQKNNNFSVKIVNNYSIELTSTVEKDASDSRKVYLNVTINADILVGKTITMSYDGWNSNVPNEFAVCGIMYNINGENHYKTILSSSRIQTLTIPLGAKDCKIRLFLIEIAAATVKAGTYTVIIKGLMICEGTVAKSWEPYTGGKPSPSPDYPQEIVSAGKDGSIGVEVHGKNILGGRYYYANYSNGVLFVSKDRKDEEVKFPYTPECESFGVCKVIKCKKGKTYVISVTNPNKNATIGMAEYENIENAFVYTNNVGFVKMSNKTKQLYTAKSDGKEIFSSELGISIIVYSKQYKKEDGTAAKFYPDGFATLIPSGALGNTWYGTTPEERTLMGSGEADVSIVNTGVAVAVTVTNDPVHTKTTASEIVLPSYERMDSTYVIKCY